MIRKDRACLLWWTFVSWCCVFLVLVIKVKISILSSHSFWYFEFSSLLEWFYHVLIWEFKNLIGQILRYVWEAVTAASVLWSSASFLLIVDELFCWLQVVKKDFENFEKLFKRFLLKSGPSVVWSEIQSPPEGYVSIECSRPLHSFLLPEVNTVRCDY